MRFGQLLSANMWPKPSQNGAQTLPKSSSTGSQIWCYAANAEKRIRANTPTLFLIFAHSKPSKIVRKSYKKWTQMRTSLGQPLEAPKNTIPDLFQLAFGSQLGLNMALSWPKSRQKWAPILAMPQPWLAEAGPNPKTCPKWDRFRSEMGPNSIPTGSTFCSDLSSCRPASTQRVRRNIHRPTSPSSCYDAQLMVVPLFCCLHAELCFLLAAAEWAEPERS